ncbi:tRNA nucleotidyltransferase [Gluconacetobacter johannae]|uniref:tRNA nucleotidyltransferase n=2 Tax=Gluconacetobacter johannae TaxID=112140 RepID=A0A7W4J6E3_9PROT|nr:tRNA nucleotidyltransferase [Gluconacetobacter johannae]
MAALLAEGECAAEEDDLDRMFGHMEAGALAGTPPSEIWPELARGLMSPAPAAMLRTLRDCGCLREILPEVAALFGVPHSYEDLGETDLGTHMLATLTEAARRHAPLSVRFALLVMNIGKIDSPPEHLPHHYRHAERAQPRIEALCDRFGVPPDCRALALMATTSVERVHRVSAVRAGPVADMLQQMGAFDAPTFYESLMLVCTCDYCAYDGRSGRDYPKAALLKTALDACAGLVPPDGVDEKSLEALRDARAMAIALIFRSLRWSPYGPA